MFEICFGPGFKQISDSFRPVSDDSVLEAEVRASRMLYGKSTLLVSR